MKKNALLLGDNLKADYHPLSKVEKLMTCLWEDMLTIHSTEDYEELLELQNYDVCILYGDRFKNPVLEEYAIAIEEFVQRGGKLLIIHNGISMQSSDRFARMVGARFINHPDYTDLVYYGMQEGLEQFGFEKEFEIQEEPYRFEFVDGEEVTLLFEYEHKTEGGGIRYPGGWTREYGSGRMVYLAPGHDSRSFENKGYQSVLYKAMEKLIRV